MLYLSNIYKVDVNSINLSNILIHDVNSINLSNILIHDVNSINLSNILIHGSLPFHPKRDLNFGVMYKLNS